MITQRSVKIGKQVLDILTTGMYSDPRMIYREFAQNAADSVDEARERNVLDVGEESIQIVVDPAARAITVTDNGLGISNCDAAPTLCSLGNSSKEGQPRRGFRGIGRLGALGYCDEVLFETRRSRSERVAQVRWNCSQLRDILRRERDLPVIDVIARVASTKLRRAEPCDAAHFFRARLNGVHHFHQDVLMNPVAVSEYLSQVAPVGFDGQAFPFWRQVEDHVSEVPGYTTYKLFVNGRQVFRPHNVSVPIRNGEHDKIDDVQLFVFKGHNGHPIARGWIAHTSCVAAIPPRVLMRGIRVRQGNIEIGNEYFLESCFTERRFATWHIGEVHVSYSLKPNARRDGFEQSADHEAFLEQATSLGQHLSNLCRTSSRDRSKRVSVLRSLEAVDTFVKTAVFLDEADRAQRLRSVTERLHAVLSRTNGSLPNSTSRRATAMRNALDAVVKKKRFLPQLLDGRSLKRYDGKRLLQEVCRGIVKAHKQGISAEEMILQVVGPYLKPQIRQQLLHARLRLESEGAR